MGCGAVYLMRIDVSGERVASFSGYKNCERGTKLADQSASQLLTLFLARGFSTLKMEATLSSETPVLARPTLHHIPEVDILHSHRRENRKSYILN
jgi:hypothetical protein